MSSKVAQRLRDGESVHQLYPELERELSPMMLKLARQFAPSLGISVDDALQEARIAVVRSFEGYDYERAHGGIHGFGRTCIKRAFLALLYQATTRTRNPHTIYTDEDGETQVAKHRFASLDQLMDGEYGALGSSDRPHFQPCSDSLPPDEDCDGERVARAVRQLSVRLMRSLGERERSVLRCKALPPESFAIFLRNIGVDANEVTNIHIGRFLGLSKNSVDWSLHKIRGQFVKMSEESPEFSGLIKELVREGRWPMVYTSEQRNDTEFVRRIIQERSLDPRPLPERRDIVINHRAGRIIEKYHWGSVLHLRLGSKSATVVVEGRFNALTGEVIGEFGNWKSIGDSVPWYKQLVRKVEKK